MIRWGKRPKPFKARPEELDLLLAAHIRNDDNQAWVKFLATDDIEEIIAIVCNQDQFFVDDPSVELRILQRTPTAVCDVVGFKTGLVRLVNQCRRKAFIDEQLHRSS